MSFSPEVVAHVEKVTPARRRRDAATLLELFARATGEEPELRGTIIGYGSYNYRYESGREGVSAAAGFAPRKTATVVYLADGTGAHPELADLGPHRVGVGCLYLDDLGQNDLDVLERVVRASYQRLTAGTYTGRARDGA